MKHNINNDNRISRRKRIAIGAIPVVIMLVCAFFAFDVHKIIAKYFLSERGEGVVYANSFYFTSDYLSPVQYDGSISEYVMSGWDGKSKKSFAFNIRNYDNPLLFNNEEQIVKYEMEYEVLNGDDAFVDVHIYKIVDGRESEELSGELKGGVDSYVANEYKLSATSKNENVAIEHDVTILLTVRTVESPYHVELQTKITLQYTSFENFIAYQGVSTEENNNRVVSLIYDINTANQILDEEMENTDIALATETIHSEWDNSMLEFHEFDKKVDAVFAIITLEEAKALYPDVTKCKNTIIIDEDNNVGHIYYDALAYSAYEIIFHKRIETWADESLWKDANGTWLWELSPAPLTEGTLIYAETVDRTVTP